MSQTEAMSQTQSAEFANYTRKLRSLWLQYPDSTPEAIAEIILESNQSADFNEAVRRAESVYQTMNRVRDADAYGASWLSTTRSILHAANSHGKTFLEKTRKDLEKIGMLSPNSVQGRLLWLRNKVTRRDDLRILYDYWMEHGKKGTHEEAMAAVEAAGVSTSIKTSYRMMGQVTHDKAQWAELELHTPTEEDTVLEPVALDLWALERSECQKPCNCLEARQEARISPPVEPAATMPSAGGFDRMLETASERIQLIREKRHTAPCDIPSDINDVVQILKSAYGMCSEALLKL